MEVTPEQARDFVGPRADYYLERWARIAPGQSRVLGFNWPAFFVPAFWLLYRRMYRAFWIFAALLVASIVLEELALTAMEVAEVPLLDAIVTIAIAAAFGKFGTYWYYLHARRRVRRLEAAGILSPEALRRDGGTSWLAAIVGVVVVVGLLLLGLWAQSQAYA